MKLPILTLLALIASTGLATAALDQEMAKCSAIAGDLQRLQCFDDLAASAGLDGPQPLPATTGDTGRWIVSHDVNPIDDTQKVVLMLTATEGKSRWGRDIVFIARCQSNATEAYINWGDYLGNDGDLYSEWKWVTIRIGDDKAVDQKWGLSTDSQATFAPDWAGTLLKQMSSATKFIAQVTPYNENPRTAVFETAGLAEALKPLVRTCGWSLDNG